MVSEKKDLGNKGEAAAVFYLRKKGYEILETNFQIGHAEIDIVARDGEQLVFVEVKTKSKVDHGFPEDAVDKRKEKILIDAADRYCHEHPIEKGIRFDIVSVIKTSNRTEIRHFVDAIFPWSE